MAAIMSCGHAAVSEPVVRLQDAALAYGTRTLWSGLTTQIRAGEFFAVLGANGSGKTSLLRALLGLAPLSGGYLTISGRAARKGNRRVGYIPQQHRIDPLTPLRARDVVRQGLDGHRWGFGRPGRVPWERIRDALASVDAERVADMPIGMLSGGEQQRVRIAQALISDPVLMLCDEPLLSLDPASQRTITSLINERRRRHRTAVVFVTHEINPVLPYVDRLLYLAGGRFRIGTVDEVLSSQTLSALYGVPIDVVRTGGRILVAGVPDAVGHAHHLTDARAAG